MTDTANDIITAEKIAWNDLFNDATFAVARGSITVIITPKEEVDAWLVRLILGFVETDRGEFSIFGAKPTSLPENRLYELRQRIGIVYANGGLISNLKIWENVTLPLSYKGRMNNAEMETLGVQVLKRAGYQGKLMQLPGHTPFHQKKAAGFARAMLMDPELMVYESPLLGLNQEERRAFMATAMQFHGEQEGRTSLFISSNPEVLPMLKDARVITINQGQQS
ncbi:organic solvent ABC transporter ATP-binding protein [Geotalea sp. SG265]|uniref:organic solvent ABC transporter ATP-binding protein n=1 Tax=Geotalea sp. SG265 TaxID=2922867 RepID=UPI001FAFEB26|nr:organic solvent ABC transporter ATP-binding protein [Geotalea sp. SG265]